MAPRCIEVCKASVTKIEPATVRYSLEDTKGAAPRYADVPTPSRTEDSVMNDVLRDGQFCF